MRVRVALYKRAHDCHENRSPSAKTEVVRGREKKERITPFAFLFFSQARHLAALLARDILTTVSEIFRLLSQLSRIYTYCLILSDDHFA